MPIYGKKDLKFFISGTERPATLKLGMQHWGFSLLDVFTAEMQTVDIKLTSAKKAPGELTG